MDANAEIREFFTSRRARLQPDEVGLPDYGPRRVAGLRREEVAALAGVSVSYYTRLERGNLSGASLQVLEAIARALRLDAAEREHLLDLSRAASRSTLPHERSQAPVRATRPGLQQAVDAITGGPAFVRNGRTDLLAVNPLARIVFDQVFDGPGRGNLARFNFLDDRARTFYADWDEAAEVSVGILRTEAARGPQDMELRELIDELLGASSEFASRWARHHVRRHGNGSKRIHHHDVGELDLSYEGFALITDPQLSLLIYSAEPGSVSEQRLRLLASLAVTPGMGPSAAPVNGARGESR